MADPEMDEDLFADLYDGEADDPVPAPTVVKSVPEPVKAELQDDTPHSAPEPAQTQEPSYGGDFKIKPEDNDVKHDIFGANMQGVQSMNGGHNGSGYGGGYGGGHGHDDDNERPINIKDDGKMFIGGLNWETTDENMKQYFSQYGEVVECTVMRDGATGRSRGFGFLTFRDPKVVNTVMVKEHTLDGKLVRTGLPHALAAHKANIHKQIDPKRAIPRDEQERTAKIFVGGVSQDASQEQFSDFFKHFGNVLDATLMMDKETGRPRGFGFVTFDSEAAVDRTLEGPLSICGKAIEVKRAQPRGDMREQDGGGNAGGGGGGGRGGGKFGRRGGHDQYSNNNNNGGGGNGYGGGGAQGQMPQDAQNGGNNMSPAMMAAYWQRMQQYFSMMQQQMAASNMAGGGGMNPMQQAMQQNPAVMQQMMARQGMNPAMMQQMAAMQAAQQGGGGGAGYPGGTGSPVGDSAGQQRGGGSGGQGFNAQEQLMFEQQKYERQSMARGPGGQRGNGNGGNRMGSQGPSVPGQAPPAGAPTGPKNAGRPGANYRGGGRGGQGGQHRGGFHPYARGGGGG
ncbi:hypothetical protein LTR08_000629 [Meristemomyces frigidus]|nr:hypothetical protein LTR08_000629 [Meristemomyces frigidus]